MNYSAGHANVSKGGGGGGTGGGSSGKNAQSPNNGLQPDQFSVTLFFYDSQILYRVKIV